MGDPCDTLLHPLDRGDDGFLIMRPVCFLLLSILFFTGCATSPPFEFVDRRISVVWPAPPDPPRIRYLSLFHGPSDFVVKKGKFSKLIQAVAGEESLGSDFITPSGISTFASRQMIVADPASRAVHWFDLVERESVQLREHGNSRLRSPVSVAFAPDGSFYVSDSELRRVFRFSARLEPLGELSGVSFERPAGIAVAHDGEKAVVDVLAHRVHLFGRDDRYLRSIPPVGSEGEMNRPVSITVDRMKNLYVVDSLNFRVVQYDWHGKLLRNFGEPGDSPGYFSRPKGIALDSEGHLYLVDATMNIVQIFTTDGRLLLPFGGEGKKPGQFVLPSGIHIDDKDRIFVADTYNRRIQVFQYLKGGSR